MLYFGTDSVYMIDLKLAAKVNFVPLFIAAPGNATVKVVADHLDHIAQVAGKR
jgi:microsomal dipeptidase-like Zn-dependent dipeptidase